MDKTNHVPPKWPHLHVSSSKEKILQSLLSAVFPCMVEANASRDDQNGGEDDVVQDTESLRLPSHNTDVLHCHGGGTARLLAGWWWKIMTSRRRTLSGQYYHELFNQYNHSHWKALCKKKDTFHNSLSCLRFINIIEWMLWTSYWLTRNKASDQTSLSLVTAAGFATSVTIELWLLRSFLHRIYCRLNSSNITERKANDLFFHSNNDSEYHRLWEDNTVSTAINDKWLPSILRTQYSFKSNQRHWIPSTLRRQYSFNSNQLQVTTIDSENTVQFQQQSTTSNTIDLEKTIQFCPNPSSSQTTATNSIIEKTMLHWPSGTCTGIRTHWLNQNIRTNLPRLRNGLNSISRRDAMNQMSPEQRRRYRVIKSENVM